MTQITRFDLLVANVYLVQTGNKNILIDTGAAGKERAIERHLLKLGVRPEKIDLIICTHGHYDHAGGARYFQQKYNTPIAVGAGDLPMIQSQHMPKLYPYTLLDRFVQIALVRDRIPSFQPTYLIENVFDLQPLGIEGEIIPLPGHTRGSVAVAFDKSVFVGDLFRGSLVTKNKACRHFFHPEVEKNVTNVKFLLDRGYDTFYCGHGSPVSRESLIRDLGKIG